MILVFAGAGGSAAVDPEQYPVTRRFFEKLPADIKKHDLYEPLCQFLATQKEEEKIDIEDLVETLDEFQTLHKIMGDSETFMGWVIQGSARVVSHTNISQLITMERNYVRTLNDMIKRYVYTLYGKPPAIERLSDWALLLKGLKEIDPAIEIFTTNYDRVLEDLIKEAKMDIEYGIVHDGIDTYVDPSFWSPENMSLPRHRRGLLTKLHGSVSWQHLNERITIAPPRPTGNHENHCILYPGYKGVPTEEPFRAFHEHLRNVMRRVYGPLTAAVFVGYAFRDDYINSILAELPPKTWTCFITKSDELLDSEPPPGAPRTSEFVHFTKGLTRKTALDSLRFLTTKKEEIQMALETEPDP